MKKLTVLLLVFFFVIGSKAQVLSPNVLPKPKLVQNSSIEFLKKKKSVRSNNQRSTPISLRLDYAGFDRDYSYALGVDFSYYAHKINKNYSTNSLNDSAANYTVKWATVIFDSLYDYAAETVYPLQGTTVTIDSVHFLYNHINTTGSYDSISISVLQLGTSPSGLLSANQGITLSNSVYWDTLIVTNQSLTPGLQPFQATLLSMPVDVTLPINQGFAVLIQFSGDTANQFMLFDACRDECAGMCAASKAKIPDNSYRYINLFTPPNNQLSGINELTIDCNNNQIIEVGSCELFYFQNWAISADVTIDVALGVNISVNNNTSTCIGDSALIFINAYGGTPPYSYSSTNILTFPNFEVEIKDTIQTFSVSITDANSDTISRTITIYPGTTPTNIISGTVRLSNNNAPANMKILLIQLDSSFFARAVDSTLTDVSGNFNFNYQGYNLFVKAIPDSLLYPFEMPTYHYGYPQLYPFLIFTGLGLYTPYCGLYNNLFFNTISGNNPGGNGFISGNIFQGAGKRQNAAAVGQYVFLVNSNNEPVDYAITNADGYFSFSNIALADYRIFVDVPNFNVNAAPTVSLNSNNPSAENLQYYLEDLVSSVVLKPFTKINEVLLFPNPTNGQVTVMSELNVDINEVSLVITDIQGKQINESTIKLNGKKLETTIDLSTYEKGCYFIQLKANEIVVNKKLMVY